MPDNPFVTLRSPAFKDRVRAFISRVHARSYVSGLAVMLVLGGGYYFVFAQGNSSTTSTGSTQTSVTRRTITTSVKAAGKVTFASEQELKFNQKGTVAKVNVKVGDAVKTGQILAELDESSVLADVRSAQLSLGASALQLQQLQAQKTQTLLDAQNAANQAQRSYEQAQSDLQVAQQKLPSDLTAAQRAVQDKQTALEQSVVSLATTAQNTLTTSDQLLDSFYLLLTRGTASRPQTNDNGPAVDVLLYRDPTIKDQVVNDYLNALNASNDLHQRYGSSLPQETDQQVLAAALKGEESLVNAINKLASDSYSMLQGATTDPLHFTDAALSTYRTNLTTYKTNATKLLNDIATAEAAVPSAQDALKAAQDSLAVLQTQTPGSLQQQKDTLQQMQEGVQSKQAAAGATDATTNINIQLKQNDIAQKAAALDKTRQSLQDYRLVAPFDGIVTHIDYKMGDNLLDTGDTEFVTLQNPDYIVVTIPLDQVDVVRVKKDMPASIVFDAVPGQTFDGVIDTIDSTPVTTSGVVSYNVSIKLPTPKDLNLLSGMTATVTIETSRKENALAVPNLAIRSVNGQTTVQLATGQSMPVQTGVTDGRYTEILSGVNEGDRIVSVNVARGASSSTNGNALRGLGGLGGGFGGPGGGGGGATVRRATGD
jgi:HlyD family secretion protein